MATKKSPRITPQSKHPDQSLSRWRDLKKKRSTTKVLQRSLVRIHRLRLDKKSALSKLTDKEFGAIKDVVINKKTQVQAGHDNYDVSNDGSAHAQVSNALQRPRVQAAVKEMKQVLLDAYERCGITEDKLATVVAAGLNANVIAKTKYETTETDIPDHEVRLKFATLAHNIRGDIVNKSESKDTSLNIHVTADPAMEEDFRVFLKNKFKKKEHVGTPSPDSNEPIQS